MELQGPEGQDKGPAEQLPAETGPGLMALYSILLRAINARGVHYTETLGKVKVLSNASVGLRHKGPHLCLGQNVYVATQNL